MRKKLFIKTFGCQMNVYDSQRIAHALSHHGFDTTDGPDDADLVVLNTCHIRENAAQKVYSDLGRLRRMRDQRATTDGGRAMTLVVAGCVAQAEGELVVGRAPFVDLVIGPQAYHRLPEMLARHARASGTVIDVDFPAQSKFDALPTDVAAAGVSAFLAVQEGCDKFCTFCVVPYTRGVEASRPAGAILNEAARLIATGAREIVLLGQNVNAYHGIGPDGSIWSLAHLIRALADLPGLQRLRYTTSHPRDVDDRLVAAHRDVAALMPFVHLPVQSGSDEVLAAMNRRHTADDYRHVVDRLRAGRPDVAMSSDFIVGFPGESDADFAATLRLVRDVGFAQAFSFKYSRRPGTPAAALPRQVPERVASERLAELQALLDAQATAFNIASIGTRMPVLLERLGREAGQLVGRSPYLQPVVADDHGLAIGDIVEITIEAVLAHSLVGRAGSPPPGTRAVGHPSAGPMRESSA